MMKNLQVSWQKPTKSLQVVFVQIVCGGNLKRGLSMIKENDYIVQRRRTTNISIASGSVFDVLLRPSSIDTFKIHLIPKLRQLTSYLNLKTVTSAQQLV